MKAVVIFESTFGNTEKLAREIGAGLASSGARVTLVNVRHARAEDLRGSDLIVVGAPARAHPAGIPAARRTTARLGPTRTDGLPSVHEWLGRIDAGFPAAATRPIVAVFDSRVDTQHPWAGLAAHRIARLLRAHGFPVLEAVTSFYAEDVRGPLARGERVRARGWGEQLAGLVRAHPALAPRPAAPVLMGSAGRLVP